MKDSEANEIDNNNSHVRGGWHIAHAVKEEY